MIGEDDAPTRHLGLQVTKALLFWAGGIQGHTGIIFQPNKEERV